MERRRWSNFLLPSLHGADNGAMSGGQVDNLVDAEDDRDGRDDKNAGSLLSHFTFGALRSYMRSKSGVEIDPDRFRRRKLMIANLPEAESVINRMRQIATNWDTHKNGQLLGFDCVSLEPTQFKELFRRNFGALLSPRDLGLLVSMYDKRGERKADSAEFLKDFCQIGREGRQAQARQREETARKIQLRHEAWEKDRISRLTQVTVGEHSEKDVKTAMAKMSEAAARYNTSRDSYLRHLEKGLVGPATFREQLRMSFGLRLTKGELAGLVSALDLRREGMIDTEEFVYRFHTIGRERRAMRAEEEKLRNEKVRQRKRKEEEALSAKIRESSRSKVKWDFTEEELERAKAIIAKAASTYDKGRLGTDIQSIAQMTMDPATFRAQLLQSFRVRLGPGELGAIFTLFDKDKSMLIDGTELMHEFFRLGREERARQLAETDQQRRRVDQRRRELFKRREDRFLEQTVAKVIWPALPHDPYDEDYVAAGDTASTSRRGGGSAESRCASQIGIRDSGEKPRQRTPCEWGETGGRSSRRRRPEVSASTAEFLAHIAKMEMSIRAMTCRGDRTRYYAADETGCVSPRPWGFRAATASPAGTQPRHVASHQQRRRRRRSRGTQEGERADAGGGGGACCGRSGSGAGSDFVPFSGPLGTHEYLPLPDQLQDHGGAVGGVSPPRPCTASVLARSAPARRPEELVPSTPPEDRTAMLTDDDVPETTSGTFSRGRALESSGGRRQCSSR